MIPQSATTEIQDKQFVFVLQPDNTLKNTEVKVFSLDDGKEYLLRYGRFEAGEKSLSKGTEPEGRTVHHAHHAC